MTGARIDPTTRTKIATCLKQGYTVRDTAKVCGVGKNTVLKIRHEVMEESERVADAYVRACGGVSKPEPEGEVEPPIVKPAVPVAAIQSDLDSEMDPVLAECRAGLLQHYRKLVEAADLALARGETQDYLCIIRFLPQFANALNSLPHSDAKLRKDRLFWVATSGNTECIIKTSDDRKSPASEAGFVAGVEQPCTVKWRPNDGK